MYSRCFVPFGFNIILKEGGTHLRAPTGLLHKEAFVPLPRLALYRVPLCQTGMQWQRVVAYLFAAYCCASMQQTCDVMPQDCLAHVFVAHCRTRMQETSNLIADCFLAHLFVLHCPVQAETKCSGKLGGGCSVEQAVSI